MENLKLNKFSEKLKSALETKEWTQAKLADALGTTQQSVSRWMTGFTEPDLETLLKLCLFLGEDPNELLGYNEISREQLAEFTK